MESGLPERRFSRPASRPTSARVLFAGLFLALVSGTVTVDLLGWRVYAMLIAVTGVAGVLLLHMVPRYAEHLSLRGTGAE